MPIQTYIGQTVDIGDKVCFLKNFHTGSSTIRKCKCFGEIIDIVKSKVAIRCDKTEMFWGSYIHIGTKIIVDCDDIICKID